MLVLLGAGFAVLPVRGQETLGVTLIMYLNYSDSNATTSQHVKPLPPSHEFSPSFLPSSSFRVRLAISLISMRDMERECVAEMSGAGGTMVEAGAVSTLLTSGDFRGRSMLRPTRLHRGILKMCLQADSPEGRKGKRRRTSGKRPVGETGRAESELDEERRGACGRSRRRQHAAALWWKCRTFLTSCTARQKMLL